MSLPGLHFELPCVEHCDVVDMRTHVMSVPPQEVPCQMPPTLSARTKWAQCLCSTWLLNALGQITSGARYRCFTRVLHLSGFKRERTALRARYIYQASTDSGLLYARATFIRLLQSADCFTRVLYSVYIHGAGLLSALQLSCVYRSILTVLQSRGKGLL